jgi:hypothetical protein
MSALVGMPLSFTDKGRLPRQGAATVPGDPSRAGATPKCRSR